MQAAVLVCKIGWRHHQGMMLQRFCARVNGCCRASSSQCRWPVKYGSGCCTGKLSCSPAACSTAAHAKVATSQQRCTAAICSMPVLLWFNAIESADMMVDSVIATRSLLGNTCSPWCSTVLLCRSYQQLQADGLLVCQPAARNLDVLGLTVCLTRKPCLRPHQGPVQTRTSTLTLRSALAFSGKNERFAEFSYS